MPELPEVETVRQGLAAHVLGRTIRDVEVPSARAARRQLGGPPALEEALRGAEMHAAVRRGKYLWLILRREGAPTGTALLAHLGMSGQLLVRGEQASDAAPPRHLRARLWLEDGVLDFVDQRTFGYLTHTPMIPTADGGPGGHGAPAPVVPTEVAHIARDALDPQLDLSALVRAMRARRTGLKRALLDQTLVSGIGNIYADEALWLARTHPELPTAVLSAVRARRVIEAAREVMRSALVQGGTSFDALYVNVNGASGYFDRSLNAYGQQGRACPRCGTEIVRMVFANRSSHVCPRCQRLPGASG